MAEPSLGKRFWTVAGLLLGSLVLLHAVGHGERRAPRRPLRELPAVLSGWEAEERPLEARIVQAAGVDDYLNRIYRNGSAPPIGVYVGYYGSQQTGDTIHSPKNCLPGSGWEPVRARRLSLQLDNGAPVPINEYVVEKGLERQLVLYWYQARGRVVASEYSAKVWLVVDAITRNRTDGALVRLVTPMADGEAQALERAVEFARAMYPRLQEFVPD